MQKNMFSMNAEAGPDSPAKLSISESFRESLRSGFLLIGRNLRIHAMNPQAERILSLKARPLLEGSNQSLPEPFPSLIQETFASGKNIKDRQIVLESEAGMGRSCLVTASLIQMGDDAPFVILLINDHKLISEIEMNIRRLDRLASVGTLATSIAHEIKNAMQSMSTFVDTFISKAARAGVMQEPDERRLIALASDESKRIRSLLNQMLRFAGPDKPTLSALNLKDILDQTLLLARHQLEAKRIDLQLHLEAKNDWVNADAYQLEQAFLNIFLNAIEAMSSDGRLTVRITQSESRLPDDRRPVLEVSIEDTGTGIAPEYFSRLFDTFFTTKRDGTGLGLSITRRIINEHGGSIDIQSQPNQGTTVIIQLPMASAPVSASSPD